MTHFDCFGYWFFPCTWLLFWVTASTKFQILFHVNIYLTVKACIIFNETDQKYVVHALDFSLCMFTLRYRQVYEHGTAIGQCGWKWLTDPKPVQPGYPVKVVDVGSWNSWKRGFVTGLAKFSGARSDERRLLTAEVSPSPLLLLRFCKSKATEYQNSLQNQSPIKHCFVSVLYGTLTFLGLVVHIISIQVKERGNAHCPRRLLWYFFLNLWRIVSLLFTVWTFQYD